MISDQFPIQIGGKTYYIDRSFSNEPAVYVYEGPEPGQKLPLFRHITGGNPTSLYIDISEGEVFVIIARKKDEAKNQSYPLTVCGEKLCVDIRNGKNNTLGVYYFVGNMNRAGVVTPIIQHSKAGKSSTEEVPIFARISVGHVVILARAENHPGVQMMLRRLGRK